jgi:pyruvate ferredoxin oxidoreductase delta subunit
MIYVKDAKLNQPWDKINVGGNITEGGTSLEVNTGDWRIMIPAFHEEKCKQCLLCFPVCPDSAIPIENEKRLDFDFKHCKGCGVCFKVCPFEGAITWDKEDK